MIAMHSGNPAAAATPGERYDYGGMSAVALATYRAGWREILEHGRWQEAERLYRETVAAAPDFIIAKSVLARITGDPAERVALYREVEAERAQVDEMGRLILDVYQMTLELLSARDRGDTPGEDFRERVAETAIANYGAFLDRYPDEWSVLIEYIEWIHAARGPQAALDEIARRSNGNTTLSFSYFPAYFHAELGHEQTAARLAAQFSARLGDQALPQPHFIDAYLLFEAGDLDAASAAIDRTLALDAEHLLAQRLKRRIEAAR